MSCLGGSGVGFLRCLQWLELGQWGSGAIGGCRASLSLHMGSFSTFMCDFHMRYFGLPHGMVATGRAVRIRALV